MHHLSESIIISEFCTALESACTPKTLRPNGGITMAKTDPFTTFIQSVTGNPLVVALNNDHDTRVIITHIIEDPTPLKGYVDYSYTEGKKLTRNIPVPTVYSVRDTAPLRAIFGQIPEVALQSLKQRAVYLHGDDDGPWELISPPSRCHMQAILTTIAGMRSYAGSGKGAAAWTQSTLRALERLKIA